MELRKKAAPFKLEQRHKVVVTKVSYGFTAKQIAEIGGVSSRLVESLIAKLFEEYKCKNTTNLVATFLRKKIIK